MKFCLCIIFLLGLSSCSKSREENVLEYAVHRIRSLDWSLLAANHGVTNHIIEPTIAYKLENGVFKLEPRLFSNWEANSKGDVWVFTVRDNVLWTDGKKLEADDFVNSIKRILQPETGVRKAEKLFIIKGAEKFYKKLTSFAKVGVRSLSQRKVEITLERGTDLILHMFTENFLSPVRTDVIAKHPQDWISPKHLVTLGPFMLKKYRFGELLEFEANKNYYRGVPSIHKVRVRMIEDEKTAIRLFRKGKVDLVQVKNYTNVSAVKDEKEVQVFRTVDTAMLAFREDADKVYPKDFRKYIYQNIFIKNTPSPEYFGIKSFQIYPSLLAREPYKGEEKQDFRENLEKLLPLKLFSPPSVVEYAERIQFKIKKKLGVQLDMVKASIQFAEKGKIGAYLASTGPYNLHPASLYYDFSGAIGEKNFGWKNSEFEKLFEEFKFQLNPSKRKTIKVKMDKLIKSNYLMIPLFQWAKVYLVSEKLKGVKMSYPYRVDLSEAYFEAK